MTLLWWSSRDAALRVLGMATRYTGRHTARGPMTAIMGSVRVVGGGPMLRRSSRLRAAKLHEDGGVGPADRPSVGTRMCGCDTTGERRLGGNGPRVWGSTRKVVNNWPSRASRGQSQRDRNRPRAPLMTQHRASYIGRGSVALSRARLQPPDDLAGLVCGKMFQDGGIAFDPKY